MAALSDRIEAHNYSMDPWECTGAAPQGWATHLQQSIMPVQGYLHLRPSNLNSVPEFGAPPTDSSAVVPVKEKSKQEMTSRQGRASKPVIGHQSALSSARTARLVLVEEVTKLPQRATSQRQRTTKTSFRQKPWPKHSSRPHQRSAGDCQMVVAKPKQEKAAPRAFIYAQSRGASNPTLFKTIVEVIGFSTMVGFFRATDQPSFCI